LIAAVASLALAAPAAAKTYEVNKRADHAPNGCKKKDCTLREAIIAANAHSGRDRVSLPEKKYRLALENPAADTEENAGRIGDLDVTDDLVLSHRGKGRARIDAKGIDAVLEVQEGAPTTLKRIGLIGGGGFFGTGVRARADLTIRRGVVADNHPELGYGGGINLQLSAGLTLTKSVVANNSVGNDGGGIQAALGPVVIKKSQIIRNEAGPLTPGGGLVIASQSEPVRIVDSTIAGNTAHSFGGGIHMYGGSVSIVNSTIADNTADDSGGGIYLDPDSELHANAVTVARNEASSAGGGIYNNSASPVEFANSLIALNVAPLFTDCGDDGGPGQDYDSEGHNLLSDDTDCQGFTGAGDIVNANPKLGGRLKSNGGPTQTVALKKGSPAINKADKQSAPNKDQRGEKRGKKPDIGAYERVKKKKGKRRR
jgi:CSLREA domain-containing protein